jgi:hypothetical protein
MIVVWSIAGRIGSLRSSTEKLAPVTIRRGSGSGSISLMGSLIFHLLAATWLTVVIAPASGAEIRHAKPEEGLYAGGARIILEGKIKTGDYDNLLKLIDEDCSRRACADGIYLASPGGNLIEAMKMGRLVRKLRLETHVPGDLLPLDALVFG